ncbi:MAG: hypothetical protein Q8L86_20245 [Vicinamibacterales bacterium]|nr:hypothetical protein [Vicinamibacterales bacterium]
MTIKMSLAIAAFGVVVGGGVDAQAPADRFTQKVVQVLVHAEDEEAAPRRTTFTESEVNSYLSLGATEHLPPSVTRPTVALLGAGRLSAAAIVDLDVVRGGSSGGWFDPLAYLSGRLPVVAIGTIDTRGGLARLQLERTEVGGVAMPPMLLQEIVSFYTRSDEAPRGVRLDEPFALPARIDRIEIARGQAVVVQ